MKIAQGDNIEQKPASYHRGGSAKEKFGGASAKYSQVFDGDPESPIDNYSVVIARTPGRYSPRHRHNFEQFRFQLEGVANYGRTGVLKPGMLGYFPEGVHYGPQTQEEGEELAVLVLQCGGASGSGYPGRDATLKAQKELLKLGTFENGVFHRKEGLPGKTNLDSFQAVWEHISGRPLVYPQPRYDAPILIHPDHFVEVSVEDAPGVFEKCLGAFTECQSEAGMMRIAAGTEYKPAGKRDIFVALSGRGRIEDEPLRRFTSLFLDFDESATIRAEEDVHMLRLRLPDLRHLVATTGASREAAE